MTLRRDLAEMEKGGLLKRVHGGAVSLERQDPGFRVRSSNSQAAKQAIGRAAAGLVQPGQCIYLDSGSTADAVAAALALRGKSKALNLRVVTHAVNITLQLAEQPGISLTMIGGEIDPATLAAGGAASLAQLGPLNFDLFFMGATGVHPQVGWTNSSPHSVDLKLTVHQRTARTWVLLDSSKWGIKSFHRICAFPRVHGFVLERPPTADITQAASAAGLEIEHG